MGIIKRIKDVFSANVLAGVQKCEDPVKMMDLYIQKVDDDIITIKAATAQAMAERNRLSNEIDVKKQQSDDLLEKAKKYALAKNEAAAKDTLISRHDLEEMIKTLRETLESMENTVQQSQVAYDKVLAEASTLKTRKSMIVAKMSAAKTQGNLSEVMTAMNGSSGMGDIARMEDKANSLLSEAKAMAALTEQYTKLDKTSPDYDVDEDLNKLLK